MPRGDKSKYTDKEKRQAEHIEEGYEKRGTPKREAEHRAWATVNKVHKGGEKPGGGGFGKPEDRSPVRKGGAASASRPKAARSASARKAAATRKGRSS
jgi:plasmid stabilization system protein ParE